MNFTTRYGAWGLVAGASEGLGSAWAHGLAARGLKLILVARRPAELEQTAAAVRAQHHVEVVTLALDLSSPGFLQALEPTLEGREVGVYVHNAAFAPGGVFLGRPAEDHLRSLDVNCRGPLLLTHALGNRMVSRGRGAIILMSSLTAFQGTPHLATYGATKAFNLIFAEALATELKPRGVDVLACCAGATRTPGYLRTTPHGAPGELEPAQVVEATLRKLGRRAVTIPGAFNRFASFLMRRVMTRSQAVQLLGAQTAKLELHP